MTLELELLPGEFTIARYPTTTPYPLPQSGWFSLSVGSDEVSLVAESESLPDGWQRRDVGWKCLRVRGPLDLSLTGITRRLSTPLANAGIAVSVIATHDTDYLLLRATELDRGVAALQESGIKVPVDFQETG